jgi:outer membrane cobalamin receptor
LKRRLLPKLILTLPIIASTILAVGFPVLAAAEQTEPQVYEEEAVVVTATRTKQEESKSPGKTEVITKEEIEASGAATVAEALTSEGVVISSYGGAAGAATVQLDGATAGQTLVLINGVAANSGTGGTVDLSYFPVAGIERIEVAHGPLSALYGANALGGVVNIITDLTGTASNQAILTSGNNAYGRLDFTLRQPQFGLAVGGLTTNGYREHSDTTNGYLMGQYDFWQTEQKALRLNWLYNTKDYEDPGSITYHPDSDSVKKNLAFDLNGKNVNDQFTVEYKIFMQRNQLDYNSGDSQDRFQTDIWGSDLAGSYQVAGHELLGGLQLQHEQLSRNETEHTWHNGAIFLQDNWQMGRQWQLVSGVRWDTGSVFSSPVSPRIGLNYKASDRFTVKFGYGKAFRAPTFDDLYYPEDTSGGYVCKGNPDLKPETSDRYEITGEWRSGSRTISLNCFTAKVTDGIIWKFNNDSNAYSPTNIAKMKINGSSLSWRNQCNQYLLTGLKYVWTDCRSWSDTTQSYSVDENESGKSRITLNLGYQRGAWNYNLDWNWVMERNDSTYGEQPDYAVLKFNLMYRVNAKLTYGLTIDNLTDKSYEVYKNYPMPGREYYLSANYAF